MVTPAMGTAMKDPMYSSEENWAQHGGHGFQWRLSTFQGSTFCASIYDEIESMVVFDLKDGLSAVKQL